MKRLLPLAVGALAVATVIAFLFTRPPSPTASSRLAAAAPPAPPSESTPQQKPRIESPVDQGAESAEEASTIDQEAARTPLLQTGLRVQLTEEAGHPVAGASIWIIPLRPYAFPPRREIDSVMLCDELAEARGDSDSLGVVAWTELTPARRLVLARKRGYVSSYAWSEKSGESARSVAIRLHRGGEVRGIVHDGDAKTAASGAFLTMTPRPRPGFETDDFATFARFLLGAATRTSSDGRFELECLSDELSELFCSLPGRPQIYVDWIIPNGQELSLRFVDNVAISGTVSDENGAPIPAANIYVTTPGVLPLPTTEAVHSDEHGEFRCETVVPGTVEVKVDKRGFGVFKQPFLVRDGGENFDITLKPEVEFSGTVVDCNGKPIHGAAVRVVHATQFVMCGQMDTLADGSWFMNWVPSDGQVDVYVTRDGYAPSNLRGVKAPQQSLRIEMAPVGSFSGRVVDPLGRPIPRFAIRGATRGTQQSQEYFDRVEDAWYHVESPDGHFGFGKMLPGPTEVSVRAIGYRPMTICDISVGSGESVGPVEFRLEPSPPVQGTVVDSDQKPVVGASVEIAESTFNGRAVLSREPFGSLTGVNGSFAIDTVPNGAFTLVIRRGESRSVFTDIHAGDFPRSFVLERDGEIVGTVNGSWARPETCARIRVSLDQTWIGREIRPDPDGRFRVSSLAPGDYRIELIDDWSEYERLRDGRITSFATVRSGESTVVMLDATGTAVIEGRVVTKGSRLAGQQISLRAFAAGGAERPVGESTVDANGLFRFDHLHAGTYRIRVGSYERGTALALDREVTVSDNAIVGPIEIVIGGGGLSGRVLRDDGSPADARVSLISSTGGQEVAAVRTDADGTYRLLSAPDGDYLVVASSATFADAYAGPVTFPSGPDAPTLEQRLAKESRVVARVRDDVGHSIGGATVEIYVTTRPAPLRRQSLDSNAQGQAEFMRLPAGSITVTASHAGYVPADPIVVGLAPDQRRTVDLVLARCGNVDVLVKDARGALLPGIEVTAALADGEARGEAPRRAKTNARGAVRLSGLRPGLWQISGDSTNQTTVEIEPGATVTAELTGQR